MCNQPTMQAFLGKRAGKKNSERRQKMADQNMDVRRIAREQESRIAAAAAVGLNAAKPLFQYQTSMLRLVADNFELLARNYERGVEAFAAAIEEQHHQMRQAAE
jgi:hypothetical protein